MHLSRMMIIAAGLTACLNAQAAQSWSACQTIVAVTDYQAYNNTLVLALSPAFFLAGPSGISNTDGISGGVLVIYLLVVRRSSFSAGVVLGYAEQGTAGIA